MDVKHMFVLEELNRLRSEDILTDVYIVSGPVNKCADVDFEKGSHLAAVHKNGAIYKTERDGNYSLSPAHKCVLAAAIPWFCEKLTNGSVEVTGNVQFIWVPVSFDTLQIVLDFTYGVGFHHPASSSSSSSSASSSSAPVSPETIHELINGSRFFKFRQLTEACEKFLEVDAQVRKGEEQGQRDSAVQVPVISSGEPETETATKDDSEAAELVTAVEPVSICDPVCFEEEDDMERIDAEDQESSLVLVGEPVTLSQTRDLTSELANDFSMDDIDLESVGAMDDSFAIRPEIESEKLIEDSQEGEIITRPGSVSELNSSSKDNEPNVDDVLAFFEDTKEIEEVSRTVVVKKLASKRAKNTVRHQSLTPSAEDQKNFEVGTDSLSRVTYKCNHCSYECPKARASLVTHIYRHHGIKMTSLFYKCLLCAEVYYPVLRSLWEHMRTNHRAVWRYIDGTKTLLLHSSTSSLSSIGCVFCSETNPKFAVMSRHHEDAHGFAVADLDADAGDGDEAGAADVDPAADIDAEVVAVSDVEAKEKSKSDPKVLLERLDVLPDQCPLPIDQLANVCDPKTCTRFSAKTLNSSVEDRPSSSVYSEPFVILNDDDNEDDAGVVADAPDEADSSSPSHKTVSLSSDTVTYLQRWLFFNQKDAMPDLETKRSMSVYTGLTKQQVHSWFIKARRHELPSMRRHHSAWMKKLFKEDGVDDEIGAGVNFDEDDAHLDDESSSAKARNVPSKEPGRVFFPRHVRLTLLKWLQRNRSHQYVTAEGVRELQFSTGLTPDQIRIWIRAARKRNYLKRFETSGDYVLWRDRAKSASNRFVPRPPSRFPARPPSRLPTRSLNPPAGRPFAPPGGGGGGLSGSQIIVKRPYHPAARQRRIETEVPNVHTALYTGDIRTVLVQWLMEHKDHPYATEAEVEEIKRKTGLSRVQIRRWMHSARNRNYIKRIEETGDYTRRSNSHTTRFGVVRASKMKIQDPEVDGAVDAAPSSPSTPVVSATASLVKFASQESKQKRLADWIARNRGKLRTLNDLYQCSRIHGCTIKEVRLALEKSRKKAALAASAASAAAAESEFPALALDALPARAEIMVSSNRSSEGRRRGEDSLEDSTAKSAMAESLDLHSPLSRRQILTLPDGEEIVIPQKYWGGSNQFGIDVLRVLYTWLYHHQHHPYPTQDEMVSMTRETGLSYNQVKNWFQTARQRKLHEKILPINGRRVRIPNPMISRRVEGSAEDASPQPKSSAAATPSAATDHAPDQQPDPPPPTQQPPPPPSLTSPPRQLSDPQPSLDSSFLPPALPTSLQTSLSTSLQTSLPTSLQTSLPTSFHDHRLPSMTLPATDHHLPTAPPPPPRVVGSSLLRGAFAGLGPAGVAHPGVVDEPIGAIHHLPEFNDSFRQPLFSPRDSFHRPFQPAVDYGGANLPLMSSLDHHNHHHYDAATGLSFPRLTPGRTDFPSPSRHFGFNAASAPPVPDNPFDVDPRGVPRNNLSAFNLPFAGAACPPGAGLLSGSANAGAGVVDMLQIESVVSRQTGASFHDQSRLDFSHSREAEQQLQQQQHQFGFDHQPATEHQHHHHHRRDSVIQKTEHTLQPNEELGFNFGDF